MHLFFVNERTPEGKCFKLATDTWVGAVNIPDANVHKARGWPRGGGRCKVLGEGGNVGEKGR